MIDIHCHILPGIDDGAPHEQASLDMALQAVNEGITGIIATPHHSGKYENPKASIMNYVSILNEVLNKEDIPLEIYPGQEPRISGELIENYEKGEVLTLNNRNQYLLVELPFDHVPRYTGQLLYDIQVKGITPIIVHPERNREIQESPDWLYKFVKDGALTQVTASSITGHFGKHTKKFTLNLIDHNLTHFVASDAHNLTSRNFRMREAFEEITNEFGRETRYLFHENAELLIEGKVVGKEMPQRIKKKKFLGLF